MPSWFTLLIGQILVIRRSPLCPGQGATCSSKVAASAIRTMSARRCTVCDSTLLDYLVQNCSHSYHDAGGKRRGCRVITGHCCVAMAGDTAIS